MTKPKTQEVLPAEANPLGIGGLSVPSVAAQMGIATTEDLEVLAGTFQGMDISEWKLPRAKKPAGLPTFAIEVAGQTSSPKEFTGTILAFRPISKAWFMSPATAAGVPPSCTSHDGITGFGVRNIDAKPEDEATSAACLGCAWNKKGSKRTLGGGTDIGKDCSDNAILLVSVPGMLVPLTVQVTPGSLSNWQAFQLGLLNVRTEGGNVAKPTDCVVKFGLQSATSSHGQPYNKNTFTLVGLREESEIADAASLLFSEMLQRSRSSALLIEEVEK